MGHGLVAAVRCGVQRGGAGLPTRCTLLGNYNPPLTAGCVATSIPTAGEAFIGVWPD